MKFVLCILLALLYTATGNAKEPTGNNPLSKYSREWNLPKYRACNTGKNARYLSVKERELLYVLNMARVNPKLFCKTVLMQEGPRSEQIDTASVMYYKSLVKELMNMRALKPLQPDSICFVSAQCHMLTSGPAGHTGHVRETAECRQKEHLHAEACHYGLSDPVGIIISLLVDQDIPSLGHRHSCLGSYKVMSPSFGPHKNYGSMVVMDFF